jgi:hypothetical protein
VLGHGRIIAGLVALPAWLCRDAACLRFCAGLAIEDGAASQ